jgi:hypothetical protein
VGVRNVEARSVKVPSASRPPHLAHSLKHGLRLGRWLCAIHSGAISRLPLVMIQERGAPDACPSGRKSQCAAELRYTASMHTPATEVLQVL